MRMLHTHLLQMLQMFNRVGIAGIAQRFAAAKNRRFGKTANTAVLEKRPTEWATEFC
jgi:hypothetical protein